MAVDADEVELRAVAERVTGVESLEHVLPGPAAVDGAPDPVGQNGRVDPPRVVRVELELVDAALEPVAARCGVWGMRRRLALETAEQAEAPAVLRGLVAPQGRRVGRGAAAAVH